MIPDWTHEQWSAVVAWLAVVGVAVWCLYFAATVQCQRAYRKAGVPFTDADLAAQVDRQEAEIRQAMAVANEDRIATADEALRRWAS